MRQPQDGWKKNKRVGPFLGNWARVRGPVWVEKSRGGGSLGGRQRLEPQSRLRPGTPGPSGTC